MNTARVFHSAPVAEAESILQTGLRASKLTDKNQIDTFLDKHRPHKLAVSRTEAIKGWLLYNNKLLDNRSGTLIEPGKYKLGPHEVALVLNIEPDKAFVSDCTAYRMITEAFERRAPAEALRSLARAYWRKLIPLTDVIAYYDEEGDSLVLKLPPSDDNPLPCHLSDVEVLVAHDIPPAEISRL